MNEGSYIVLQRWQTCDGKPMSAHADLDHVTIRLCDVIACAVQGLIHFIFCDYIRYRYGTST